MAITTVTDLNHPALDVYARLTEAQLLNRLQPEKGIFIAESPKVIRTALTAGFEPISLLCESRHISGDAADIIAACPTLPVYTGSRELLSKLTGYTLTRGVLCAMRRPILKSPEQVCEKARRVCIIHQVSDTTNIGAIFRSAAALGIDAVLLSPGTCDPLYRRSVRVSMGSVFLVPWTWLKTDSINDELHTLGFRTAALALTDNSIGLTHPALRREPRLALILGTEGDGLPLQVISEADYTIRIPMAHSVDSLNVAAASAVAFWELCK